MNVNSMVGFQNLPAQSITVNTATALLVPAQGLTTSLPSPTLVAGSGLYLSAPQDVAGSELDGHPFKVRVAGKIFTGAASTFTTILYQVPASIIAAGTVSTLANDNSFVSSGVSASVTGAANFILEAEAIWDSTTQKLTGFITTSFVSNAITANVLGSAGTSVAVAYASATGVNGLNFIPSFTFATANAANTVTVTEFVIDRV